MITPEFINKCEKIADLATQLYGEGCTVEETIEKIDKNFTGLDSEIGTGLAILIGMTVSTKPQYKNQKPLKGGE